MSELVNIRYMLDQALKTILFATFIIMSACHTVKVSNENSVNNDLIIYYNPEVGNKDLLKAAKKYGSGIIYIYKNINGIAVSIPKNKTALEAIKYYERVNGVTSVAQDRILQLD